MNAQDKTPKLPLAARVFAALPKRGPLGKVTSVLNAVWRIGGPVQALKVAFKVIKGDGFQSLFKLVGNASNTIVGGVQVAYEPWAQRFLIRSEGETQRLQRLVNQLVSPPKISVLVPTYNTDPEFLELALSSVRNQIYQNWELCIADDASPNQACRDLITQAAQQDSRIKYVFRNQNGQISQATNSALALATGEYVTFLDHDDELTDDALAIMAVYARTYPEVTFFYSDEDKIDRLGKRSEPHFKPDLNRTLALSMNYFCHLSMYKTERVLELGGLRSEFDGAQDYDLALRMLSDLSDEQIMHVPHVLYHWRILPESTSSNIDAKPYALPASRAAVAAYVSRLGLVATVRADPELPILNQVIPTLTEHPLVSIIIPTRDQVELLKACIDSILSFTTYPSFEILIINNGSQESETLDYLQDLENGQIRVLDYPHEFNYSAINNFAVENAQGDYVCLLNNDIEVISHDWLEQMLAFAQLPGTGAVGAKLLYPDGRIQHAGVVLGVAGLARVAGHAHKFFAADATGYMGRAMVANEFSAVTGACLLVSKSKYLQVHGLTQELTVGYNDVDFCLKLLAAGYKNVFVPQAKLTHHESVSRGLDTTKAQIERASNEVLYMRNKWGEILDNDPSYNRHLSGTHENFSLAWPPRKSNRVY